MSINVPVPSSVARAGAIAMPLPVIAPLDSIRPYENNPRRNRSAITKLARLIQSGVGFLVPIVVDADRVIIAGHTRFEALKRLGQTEAPIIVADHLDPVAVKTWRLADNRIGEEAEWDKDQLRLELQELELDGADLSLTMFEETELSLISQGEGLVLSPGDAGESTSGSDGMSLRFGPKKVPINEDEFNQLVSLLHDYVNEHGSPHGFAGWMVERIRERERQTGRA